MLKFARRRRRNPCTWSGCRTPCLASSRTLLCTLSVWSWSFSPSCQVHGRYPPEHRRVPFRAHPGTRPPVSPGSSPLHQQWPCPLVPGRRKLPKLGLLACSKHGPCNWAGVRVKTSHSFNFLRQLLKSLGLVPVNSSGGSLLCLMGSDIRDSTSSAVSSSSSNATFIFSPTLRLPTNGRRTAKTVIKTVSPAVNAALV